MWYRRLLASCNVFLPTALLKYSSLGFFPVLASVSLQTFGAACFQGSASLLAEHDSGEECAVSARMQPKGAPLTSSHASFSCKGNCFQVETFFKATVPVLNA